MRGIAFVLALALASPAWAEEHGCISFAKLKADLKPGVTIVSLSPGQMNWLRGYYAALPPQLEGEYPGTSAILLEPKGADGGLLAWIKGKLACGVSPVSSKFIAALKDIHSGPLNAEGEEI